MINNLSLMLADANIGAGVAQTTNGQYSFLCASIAAVITLTILFNYHRIRKHGRITVAAVILMLFHPIWTVSAIGGDLGYAQRFYATIVTVVIAAMMILMFCWGQNWGSIATKGQANDERRITNG